MDFSQVYKKQIDKVWVELDRLPDSQFLISSLQNIEHRKKIQRLTRPFMHKITKGQLDPTKQDDIARKAFVGTVLLDWKNLTENGKPLKFSNDNALRLLKDFPIFYEDLQAKAENLMEDDEIQNNEEELNLKK